MEYVFDLIIEHTLISGHPPFYEFKKKKILFRIISSDFREGNTNLLYRPDGHNGEDYRQST